MNSPIYHNLSSSERIYQNLTGPPRAIRRTDSSLKRRIARKHSFSGSTTAGSATSARTTSEPARDAAAAAAVSDLLRQINFPSLSRRPEPAMNHTEWNRKGHRAPKPAPPAHYRSEGDLVNRLDPQKLEAVLRFMEAHNIDPFLNDRGSEPRGLRRIQSERNLGAGWERGGGGRWSSMERLPSREKKKRKSSFFGGRAGDDLEYGPGIVEKLKAKFSKLSSGLSRESRSRRSPSVDELNNHHQHHEYEPIRHMEPPPLARRHSKSTNDIYAQEEPRTYTIHRVVRIEPEEEPIDVPCISTLRRKFESPGSRQLRVRPVSADLTLSHSTSLNYDAPPPRGLRLVEAEPYVHQRPQQHHRDVTSPVTSPLPPLTRDRPFSPPVQASPVPVAAAPVPSREPSVEPTRRLRVLEVLNRNEDEPEFVKIGRTLRKSSAPPPDLFETAENHRPQLQQHDQEYHEAEKQSYAAAPHAYYEPPRVEPTRVERPVALQQETPAATTMIIDTPKVPAPRKFLIRNEAQLPTISSNFRVIRESSMSFDLPPDPEQTRASNYTLPSSTQHHQQQQYQPQTVVHSPPASSVPQGSPPPEEPHPPVKEPPMEVPCALCEKNQATQPPPAVAVSKSDARNDDGEGFNEVQRLLSRFQMSRTSRGVFEVPHEEPPRATVVDVRSSNVTSSSMMNSIGGSIERTPPPAPTAPRPATASSGRVNVVSISVRSDAPSVITTSQNSTDCVSPVSTPTPSKRPAPSPPEDSLVANSIISPPIIETSVPPLFEEPRKSLSSQYLEEKARRERPYGDDVTELRTEPRESSVDDEPIEETKPAAPAAPITEIQDSEASSTEDSESEDIFSSSVPMRPFTLSFSEPMIAGDGNPVRHTLLSLVMEEDIPALLEAMNEKHNFVFEDLTDRPSTSSIIHPVETRKLRRQQRKVTSIKFQEEAPMVYTYLDEVSCEASQQWTEGAHLDYDAYQRMLEAEQEELDQSLSEIARWKQAVVRGNWEDAQDVLLPSSTASAFNSLPDPSTISV